MILKRIKKIVRWSTSKLTGMQKVSKNRGTVVVGGGRGCESENTTELKKKISILLSI